MPEIWRRIQLKSRAPLRIRQNALWRRYSQWPVSGHVFQSAAFKYPRFWKFLLYGAGDIIYPGRNIKRIQKHSSGPETFWPSLRSAARAQEPHPFQRNGAAVSPVLWGNPGRQPGIYHVQQCRCPFPCSPWRKRQWDPADSWKLYCFTGKPEPEDPKRSLWKSV